MLHYRNLLGASLYNIIRVHLLETLYDETSSRQHGVALVPYAACERDGFECDFFREEVRYRYDAACKT